MSTFLNKNIFKLTFLFVILTELFSFFGWLLPEFGYLCFFAIMLLTLVLSIKRLEYGIYILLAELFIGSKGYLFSLDIGDSAISLRMGLFLIVMAVFFMNVILKRRPDRATMKDLFNKKLKQILRRHEVSWLLRMTSLWLVIIWGFVWGLIQGNNFGNVFLDFNNWVYFLLVFPIFQIVKNNDNFVKNILSVLTASVVWIGIKSLVLLYIFSHELSWALPEAYKWVRDTLVGEITFAGNGFWRVFIQSQVYSLILFFILLGIKDIKRFFFHHILLLISLITIILSWSRSFWVGLVVGVGIYLIYLIIQKIKFLSFLKISGKLILITLISFGLILCVIYLPPKADMGNLADIFGKRLTQGEAASSSRINQLKPLIKEIGEHPVIGSGFGTTITYLSDDPRILGDYTTYAFEWGYLDMILKFGILGTLIYLILIFKILKKLFNINLGFALALIALLIVNIFSPYLNHPLGIGFVILCSSIVYAKE
ncbi:MAG: O-antigen ligase family protein [Patescibacteria group bacterium]